MSVLDQCLIREIFADAGAIITGDHFVYAKKETGWFHGDAYVNKDAVYPYVEELRLLCREIQDRVQKQEIEVVVGPTVGAVALSQWVAHYFHEVQGRKVCAVFADEEDALEPREICPKIPEICPKDPPILVELLASGKVTIETSAYFGYLKIDKIRYQEKVGTRRVLRRGYDKFVKGKPCLVVEDIINSGITVQKTISAVKNAGGDVVAVGALCNRSGGKVTAQTLCVPSLFSLLELDMKMYPEDECPICREKGPKSVRTDLGKGKDFLTRKGLFK